MQFNEVLKKLMTERNVTAYKLSKDIGCSPQTVTNWLSGAIPGSNKLQAIAGYFGVSTDYLMGADDTDSQERYEQQEVADMLDDVIKAIRGED